jgi:HSP20 family protein
MSLVRWQPLHSLDSLRRRINELFESLAPLDRQSPVKDHWPFPFLSPYLDTEWVPSIELKDTETELILKAQIPGINPKDLDIQVSADSVKLAGEYREEKETKDKDLYCSEFHFGSFQRVVPMPVPVYPDQASAEFNHGVLKLTLPKVKGATPTTVNVEVKSRSRA